MSKKKPFNLPELHVAESFSELRRWVRTKPEVMQDAIYLALGKTFDAYVDLDAIHAMNEDDHGSGRCHD